jgi:hypothetical protein
MKNQNLKSIKQIREILKFLNETFPDHKYPKFRAYLSPDDDFRWWNIVTDDWFLYMGSPTGGNIDDHEDFKLCKEAIRTKFKNLNMVFAYQYYVSGSIKLKAPGHILVK